MTSITLLHGFTQTTDSFDPLGSVMARHGIDVDTPALPGHGMGHGPDRVVTGDLWSGAEDLAADRRPGVWLGYSMGARLALHIALAHPETVNGLILIGATAGIDDADARAERRSRDDALAARIEQVGVSRFLDEWLVNPLFASMPEDPHRKARRATNTAAGLASSLRQWGTGTMDPPLWDRLGSISAPTLVMAGTLDSRFTTLGHRIADGIGTNAAFVPIPVAGHAAHIERPEVTATLIADWLTTAVDC